MEGGGRRKSLFHNLTSIGSIVVESTTKSFCKKVHLSAQNYTRNVVRRVLNELQLITIEMFRKPQKKKKKKEKRKKRKQGKKVQHKVETSRSLKPSRNCKLLVLVAQLRSYEEPLPVRSDTVSPKKHRKHELEMFSSRPDEAWLYPTTFTIYTIWNGRCLAIHRNTERRIDCSLMARSATRLFGTSALLLTVTALPIRRESII